LLHELIPTASHALLVDPTVPLSRDNQKRGRGGRTAVRIRTSCAERQHRT
jgi:hypothetical protein